MDLSFSCNNNISYVHEFISMRKKSFKHSLVTIHDLSIELHELLVYRYLLA